MVKAKGEVMTEKRKKALKVILGVLIGYSLIVFVGYFGVAYYFSDHFLKGTVINGIDGSNKTAQQVKEDIQEKIGEYKLRIKEIDGKTETISALQLKLTYVDDNKVDQLLEEQNQWKWLTAFANKNSFSLAANTTYDEKLLDEVLNDMSCFQPENIVEPANAYLDMKDGQLQIIPEVVGTKLDREKTVQVIRDAVDQGKTELDLEAAGCYVKPEIYQDDAALIKEKEEKNVFMKTDLTYDFGDRQEKVNSSLVKDWLVLDDQGKWQIDRKPVEEYVKQLAQKYDTFGLEHEFTNFFGKKITLKGGDYGWVIQKKKTVDALIENIKEGKTGTIKPVYLYEGKSRDTNDIGGTYVEISIQDQRMWCYKDGKVLVDTPVVTGNVSKKLDTPAGGVWAIDAKKKDAVLKGENYEQPVEYWMPFNGNVGIHDADTFRTQYGGEIYKTGGSHGCVNTPTENAKKIFDIVEIGTPVIVY